jgi:uncharacterized SAM-binding protein YcdF (DUF218 family)
LKEFLSLIIMPLPVFFLLILAGFFFFWQKKKKTAKYLFFISGFWFLAVTTRPLPVMLVNNLEKHYRQLSDSTVKTISAPCNIIVLGAGYSDDPSLSSNNQLSSAALGRLVEGIRIYKGLKAQRNIRTEYCCTKNRAQGIEQYPEHQALNPKQTYSRLVVSGYAGKLKMSQAEVLFKTALFLGIDSSNLIISLKPKNTREEAIEYLKLCGSSTSVILVTDAIHMPRAIMLFKKTGLIPIPAPTNYLIKHGTIKNPWRWIPSTGNIQMMEAVTHEYAGLLLAKIARE